ncbi:MAG: hypothetical protein JWM12_781 [Ilumatobacteraceae bacterium]|jgi:hypothetical protein|nr:hypothetical protein [Ilumatobacteraceae bacterium]
MAGIEQRGVTVNGVDVAYLTIGEGPLASCPHGFPGHFVHVEQPDEANERIMEFLR